MNSLLLLLFVLHAALMTIDEFYFHSSRGLPKWERVGHPLDTLSVILCLLLPYFFNPANLTIGLFLGLSVISCLLITKDEWVHAKNCCPQEHWLHSLLFILHPILLGLVGWHWIESQSSLKFIRIPLSTCIIFGSYQIIYWNGPWKKSLTTKSTTN